jgi:hypothetical protein
VYWRRRLGRLEIALYTAIVAIAAAVFIERLLYHLELAERSAMDLTVSRLNSAINTRLAYDLLSGRSIDAPAALERNPFQLAGMSPTNFHGEVDHPYLPGLERGSWVFDRSRKDLIYLPRLRRGLRSDDPDEAIRPICWYPLRSTRGTSRIAA